MRRQQRKKRSKCKNGVGWKSLLCSCLLKVGFFFFSLSVAKSCSRLGASPTQHSKAGPDLPVQGRAASASLSLATVGLVYVCFFLAVTVIPSLRDSLQVSLEIRCQVSSSLPAFVCDKRVPFSGCIVSWSPQQKLHPWHLRDWITLSRRTCTWRCHSEHELPWTAPENIGYPLLTCDRSDCCYCRDLAMEG